MITLESVKTYLNIDFSDNDTLLKNYIENVKNRAATVIGAELDTPELDTPEIDGAMLEDVAHMYANRGESVTGSDTAFATYRRLSKRPMF